MISMDGFLLLLHRRQRLSFLTSLHTGGCMKTIIAQLFNHQNTSYLQVLRIISVTLGPNPDICGFANLTTLDLWHVLVPQGLHYLLLKCPALEWLSIRLCSLLHDLHAAEPWHRLKFLCVQDCSVNRIELNAPNLTTFEYKGGSNVLITLNNVWS